MSLGVYETIKERHGHERAGKIPTDGKKGRERAKRHLEVSALLLLL